MLIYRVPVAPDPLLDDLDPEQRMAVLSDGAPLCIVAPAGSGKTRVLTRRIAHRVRDGSADPSHVLVITFTRRAAGELGGPPAGARARATRSPPARSTAWRTLLRQRWEDQRRRAPALAVARLRLVEEVLGDLRRHASARCGAGGRGRDRLGAGPAARPDRRTPAPPRRPGDARTLATGRGGRRSTSGTRREAGAADGRLRRPALAGRRRDALETDAEFAAAQRWRFRHLFVDEFQDVNPLQHAPARGLARRPRRPLRGRRPATRPSTRWNGADGRWLDDFPARHPGGEVVRLAATTARRPRSWPSATRCSPGAAKAARWPAGRTVPRPRPIAFARTADAEAAGVAALVRDARPPGGRWRAIAVLARTNAQLQPVAAALTQGRHPPPPAGRAGRRPATAAALVELRSVTGPGSLRAWLEDTLGGAGRTAEDPGDGTGDEARARRGRSRAAPLPAAFVRAAEDLLAQRPGRRRAHAAGLAHRRRRRARCR